MLPHSLKRCWHNVACSQEFCFDHEHVVLIDGYDDLCVMFIWSIVFYIFLYDALSWDSFLFFFCMGCECIMKKAILGSAHHFRCIKHYMFFVLFKSIKCLYGLCGFISLFFSTTDERRWILDCGQQVSDCSKWRFLLKLYKV